MATDREKKHTQREDVYVKTEAEAGILVEA